MNKIVLYILIASVSVLYFACQHNDPAPSYFKVYKYDRSIQCESTGIELEEMMLELTNAGIDVACAQEGHDGLYRTTVCGAGTGKLNIYKINKKDLQVAESLGFQSVADLSEYKDRKCE